MTEFKLTHKIGDIVALFPGAANVFMAYRIDFCCGGNRSLEEAIKDQDINKDRVLEELNKEFKAFEERKEIYVDWKKETRTNLINHVVETHHNYLNLELPRISKVVRTILSVHGQSHPELFKVHRLFNTLRTELEEHLIKEEQLIFPVIIEYEKTKDEQTRQKALKAIEELEAEHTAAGDIIKELQKTTNYYTPPADGCGTYQVAYEKLKELEKDTFEHIHLENNILFKSI